MRLARFLIAFALAAAAQESTFSPYPTSLYYVVFLHPDPSAKPLSEEEGARLKTAHLANVRKMVDDGVLAAAGPFDDEPLRIAGIFVMKTKSADEALKIIREDPLVKTHRNTIDVHTWRAPEGIGDEYFRLHKEHPDMPEKMAVQPLMILTHGSAWNEVEPNQRVPPLANHVLYIEKLHREGKLAAAGNVGPDADMVGIVVFHRIPMEEARQLIAEDPAVKAGLISVEAHRWWSSDHVLPW